MAEARLGLAGNARGALSLACREWIRFLRQRHRVFAAVAQPLLFWLLFGAGLSGSFTAPQGFPARDYASYFFPGTVVLVVLFTAIFSTISIIEDRREGFLQGVLVSPLSRTWLAVGKVGGGATLATVQGLLLLALAPFAGASLTPAGILEGAAFLFWVAAGLTALGFCIAWRMDSTQGYHAIMMMGLMPMWLLSGAFFPASGIPSWLAWVIRLNPLTYGVAGFRRIVLGATGPTEMRGVLPSHALCWGVVLAFAAAMLLLAAAAARKTARRDLA